LMAGVLVWGGVLLKPRFVASTRRMWAVVSFFSHKWLCSYQLKLAIPPWRLSIHLFSI
jgi:hypothetical protein